MEDGYRVEILRSPDRFGDLLRIRLVVDGDRLLDSFKSALQDFYGIREGYAEGELKATKEHLKDLKTILFNKMEIQKEGG